MTEDEFLDAWDLQCKEWFAIASELAKQGKSPSAYDVSLEQKKRALAEGRRLLTHEDLEKVTRTLPGSDQPVPGSGQALDEERKDPSGSSG